MTALTRAITWSDFDHVAMIMKFSSDPNDVYFIEAVGEKGVSLNKWSFTRNHIGPDKFYAYLVYRHVEFNRGSEAMDKLTQYTTKCLGK